MPDPARRNPLHVVATPIGNLQDLTPRAAAALREADVIFAEDTRVTQVLVRHVGGRGRLVSLHAHNERARLAAVLEALGAGQTCALVSDAGTPLVSDPGALVIRGVLDAGFEVTPVPGPSAVMAALAASGFVCVPFAFFGFIARERQPREAQIEAMRAFAGCVVAFETKERLGDSLAHLERAFGGVEIVVAREMTKRYETFYRGPIGEVRAALAEQTLKGELTLVIAPRPHEARAEPLDAVLAELVAESGGERRRPVKALAQELSLRTGIARKEAYRLLLTRLEQR